MRGRITEVDQQPITQVLGYISIIAPDHGGTGFLILLHDFP